MLSQTYPRFLRELRGNFCLEPAVLSWFTANIGAHPVHHLASRIPSYRLPEVLADHPELRDVGRLTFSASLKCFRLALWDEEAGRLVPFRALRKLPA